MLLRIIPNFHVILIHFPLAFFGFGLIIEIFSILWKNTSFHSAGRWMILLGALSMATASTSGIYALYDVVGHGQASSPGWSDLKQSSGFSAEDWHQAKEHVLYTAVASGLALVTVIAWLAGADRFRRTFYWPGLVILSAAMGMLTMGAWHGGEMIFRQGFGVEGRQGVLSGDTPSTQPTMQDRFDAILPAMQVHLIMAGLIIAAGAGALGTGFRRANMAEELQEKAERTELQRRLPERLANGTPAQTTQGQTQTATVPPVQNSISPIPLAPNPAPQTPAPSVEKPVDQPVDSPILLAARKHVPGGYPVVRLWLLAAAFALVTIFAGLYFAGNLLWPNVLNINGLNGDLNPIKTPGQRRAALHIVFGGAILLLILVLALLGRLTPRDRLAMGIISAVLTLLIAAQFWIGILLLYDGNDGPLAHFK